MYNRAHGGGLGANLCLIFDFGDHTYSRACRRCLESQQPAQRRSYGDRDGKLRPKDHPVPPNRLRKVLLRIESNPADASYLDSRQQATTLFYLRSLGTELFFSEDRRGVVTLLERVH